MSAIHCKVTLFKIGTSTILKLPKDASAKLPSRGMVMVEGTVNGAPFQSALEPDGMGSHWFNVDKALGDAAHAGAGDVVMLEVEPSKEWPEPKIPADLKSALASTPQVRKLWMDITPKARWDWLRWINATAQSETRKRRIEVAFSKLKAGERRPCCFNRSMCTDPSVSKSGVLLEPTK